MTTDGGLDRWGSNGPIVWHSETSGLDLWGSDGTFSDYAASESPPSSTSVGLIGRGLCGNSPLVGKVLG